MSTARQRRPEPARPVLVCETRCQEIEVLNNPQRPCIASKTPEVVTAQGSNSPGDIPKPYRKSSPYGLSGTEVAERLVEHFWMAGGRQALSFEGRSTSKELGRMIMSRMTPVSR